MNKERNCQACIHHISGLCSKWDCDMQTLEDYRDKVIDEFAEELIQHISQMPSGYIGSGNVLIIAEQMKAGAK